MNIYFVRFFDCWDFFLRYLKRDDCIYSFVYTFIVQMFNTKACDDKCFVLLKSYSSFRAKYIIVCNTSLFVHIRYTRTYAHRYIHILVSDIIYVFHFLVHAFCAHVIFVRQFVCSYIIAFILTNTCTTHLSSYIPLHMFRLLISH